MPPDLHETVTGSSHEPAPLTVGQLVDILSRYPSESTVRVDPLTNGLLITPPITHVEVWTGKLDA